MTSHSPRRAAVRCCLWPQLSSGWLLWFVGYLATRSQSKPAPSPAHSKCVRGTVCLVTMTIAGFDGAGGNVLATDRRGDASPPPSGRVILPSVESVFSSHEGTTTSPVTRSGLSVSKQLTTRDRARTASVRQEDIPHVLERMAEMGVFPSVDGAGDLGNASLLREPDPSVVVFDVDALRAAFAAALEAFPPHWKHCLAMKSCPLTFVVKEALDAGLGVEAASFVELYMGLACGCPADLVVFDSPAKSNEELEMALARGVLVNANSLDELDRIDAILKRSAAVGGAASHSSARVGVRLNPLVGAGAYSELSVSIPTSKFGVPATAENTSAVVEAFRRWPWLVALHSHVGSQGCSLDMLGKGVGILCDIADVIDRELGMGRVSLLDIGGGLPANFESDEVTPTFSDYAEVLRRAAPSLFENTERRVLTEFGRAFVAKAAVAVSTVEYVRNIAPPQEGAGEGLSADEAAQGGEPVSSVSNGEERESPILPGHQTLITHMGADLFVRSSYCPGKFSHRLSMYGRTGAPLCGPSIRTDVAGPLCFEGDYVARGASLPRASPGDLVVAYDTGANTLSLFSRHCSRRAPAVFGYSRDGDGQIRVRLVKDKETVQDVARFWGTGF